MIDLDTQLRAGLRSAVASLPDPDPVVLAAALRSAEVPQRRGRRRLALALAAAVLVLAAVAAVLVRSGPTPSDRVRAGTTTTTSPEGSFQPLGAGWHEIDPGPVPPMWGAALAWTGSHLIVAGQTDEGTEVWSYLPGYTVPEGGSGSPWAELVDFPLDGGLGLGLVWADGKLLAVEGSFPSARAAVWEPDGGWREIDHPPALEALVQAGRGLVGADRTAPALVWTGQRVLDLTHGSAWNPDDETWSQVAMPDGLAAEYSHLVATNPVWDGREVLAVAWSTEPGLAWDATGSSVREVPGVPEDLGVDPSQVQDTVAVRSGDGVLLVAGTEAGNAARRGSDGSWDQVATVPGMLGQEGCPYGASTVGDRVVVNRCDGGSPEVQEGDGWVSTGPMPIANGCCMGSWLDAGGALVAWQTDRDLQNGRREEYREGAVWVPSG